MVGDEVAWVSDRLSAHFTAIGKRPSVIVELGGYGTTTLLTRLLPLVVQDEAILLAVGNMYELPVSDALYHVEKPLHSRETGPLVRSMLGDRNVDILIIVDDGTYASVRNDYRYYLPMVSEDGVVVIYGIANSGAGVVSMADSFWCGMLSQTSFEGYYGKCGGGQGGMGIIYNGGMAALPLIRDNVLAASGDLPTEQIKEEISWFLGAASMHMGREVDAVVEIGSLYGGTAALLTSLLRDGGTLVCIDPGASSVLLGENIKRVAKKSDSVMDRGDYNYDIQIIRSRSEEYAAFLALHSLLDGRQVDVLFIDGDHSGLHPLYDYTLYGSMVKRPGVIGFHDIRNGVLQNLWREVSGRESHRVIGTDLHRRRSFYGIGMLLL